MFVSFNSRNAQRRTCSTSAAYANDTRDHVERPFHFPGVRVLQPENRGLGAASEKVLQARQDRKRSKGNCERESEVFVVGCEQGDKRV